VPLSNGRSDMSEQTVRKKLQLASQFSVPRTPVYPAASKTGSRVEIASQAEYAGSIPVIGSIASHLTPAQLRPDPDTGCRATIG